MTRPTTVPPRVPPRGIDETQPFVPVGAPSLLTVAARLVDKHGRARRTLINAAGCLCPVAAIALAAGACLADDNGYEVAAGLQETRHLALEVLRDRPDLTDWSRRVGPMATITRWADCEPDDRVVSRLMWRAASSWAAVREEADAASP